MFFGDHFTLQTEILQNVVTIGYKRAMSELRKYELVPKYDLVIRLFCPIHNLAHLLRSLPCERCAEARGCRSRRYGFYAGAVFRHSKGDGCTGVVEVVVKDKKARSKGLRWQVQLSRKLAWFNHPVFLSSAVLAIFGFAAIKWVMSRYEAQHGVLPSPALAAKRLRGSTLGLFSSVLEERIFWLFSTRGFAPIGS